MKTKPLYLSDRDRALLLVAVRASIEDMTVLLESNARHERPQRQAATWLRDDLTAMLGRLNGMDAALKEHASR